MDRKSFLVFIKSLVTVQLFFAVLVVGVSLDINQIIWGEHFWLNRLSISLPKEQFALNNNQAAELFRNANVMFAWSEDTFWANSRYFSEKMPRDMMVSNIQVLASADHDISNHEQTDGLPGTYELPAIIQENADEPMSPEETIKQFKGRQVALYCTHTAETYIPDSGKPRLDGKRGLITKVAEEVAVSLKKQGLDAAFYNEIHDFPEYDRSYTNSRQTVKEILNNPDQVVAMFDVHRDSIPGLEKAETVKIDGKEAARILIIVGTDQRKEHPHWKENLAFANRIAQCGEQMYPGLIKGVRTKAGTYNQEYHTHALLIEFGSDQNSLPEARYAARLFSDILIKVLLEENN